MKVDRNPTRPIFRGKSKTKKAQGTLKVIASMQAEEKEKRAAELVVANSELAFQNHE